MKCLTVGDLKQILKLYDDDSDVTVVFPSQDGVVMSDCVDVCSNGPCTIQLMPQDFIDMIKQKEYQD